MSVYVALKYHNCIKIMTDGASWDADGNLAKVGSKVYAAENLPLALTGRGHDGVFHRIAAMVVAYANRCGSVDLTIEGVQKFYDVMRYENAEISKNDLHFDLVVAGYSEANGFFVKVISTIPSDPTPYVFRDREQVWGCPTIGAAINPFLSGVTAEKRNFLKLRGVELMNAIRLAPLPKTTDWGAPVRAMGAAAGGLVELTTVTREGVTTVQLADYKDPLGEPINPYRHLGNVELLKQRNLRAHSKAKRRVA